MKTNRRGHDGIGFWAPERAPRDPHSRPEASMSHIRRSLDSIIASLSAAQGMQLFSREGLEQVAVEAERPLR